MICSCSNDGIGGWEVEREVGCKTTSFSKSWAYFNYVGVCGLRHTVCARCVSWAVFWSGQDGETRASHHKTISRPVLEGKKKTRNTLSPRFPSPPFSSHAASCGRPCAARARGGDGGPGEERRERARRRLICALANGGGAQCVLGGGLWVYGVPRPAAPSRLCVCVRVKAWPVAGRLAEEREGGFADTCCMRESAASGSRHSGRRGTTGRVGVTADSCLAACCSGRSRRTVFPDTH